MALHIDFLLERYATLIKYLPQFISGAQLTLELLILSVFFGFFLAVPIALMRVAKNRVLFSISYAYIYFFRGTPLLVQLYLIYNGLPQVEWLKESFLWSFFRHPFYCALLALVLNTAGYTAEIFRSGIQAVGKGDIEAGKSIGLNKVQLYSRIILPKAFRLCLPAYGNEIILLLKGTALASTITLMELTGTAKVINARTFLSYEVFLTVGLIYLLISFILTKMLKALERALRIDLLYPKPVKRRWRAVKN